MPRYAKRKFTPKRRTYKKRPFHRRRGIRTNRKGSKVYYFKRTRVEVLNVMDFGFASVDGLLSHSCADCLLDVPGYLEFQAMFDQYKINGIRKRWVFDKSTAVSNSLSEIPELITHNDYNDDDPIPSESAALQCASYKASRLDRPRNRYWKPRHPLPVNTLGGSAFATQWLRTANDTGICHYGLKWALHTNQTTNLVGYGQVRVYTTYYMAFKDPK